MNRERVRLLVEQIEDLLNDLRQTIDEPDETPPASTRNTGPGSRLILEDIPPVDDVARQRGRRAVRRLKERTTFRRS